MTIITTQKEMDEYWEAQDKIHAKDRKSCTMHILDNDEVLMLAPTNKHLSLYNFQDEERATVLKVVRGPDDFKNLYADSLKKGYSIIMYDDLQKAHAQVQGVGEILRNIKIKYEKKLENLEKKSQVWKMAYQGTRGRKTNKKKKNENSIINAGN